MIYAAKLRIQVTTTVVQFVCCSFRTHFKGVGWSSLLLCAGTEYRESHRDRDALQRGWLKHGNRVQISLACRHCRHRVSCIHGTRVAAKHCVRCCPWLQSLATYCWWQFTAQLQCTAQLGSPHNAAHCLVLAYIRILSVPFSDWSRLNSAFCKWNRKQHFT